jgi:hypothetical protein
MTRVVTEHEEAGDLQADQHGRNRLYEGVGSDHDQDEAEREQRDIEHTQGGGFDVGAFAERFDALALRNAAHQAVFCRGQ